MRVCKSFELLTRHDELCAQDIIERLGVSQSTVSRHLSQLRATGYIVERRREVSECYSLNTYRVVDSTTRPDELFSRE
ncbi:MAG: helix-turn-helix transcriptional regulator [Chloroflexi bacterium]|uniref:ArsR family transcriptional regulator n=1 Tax=Candidatus Flexifilum breve TaxID=3140694 RepID=UPI003135B9DC|nr:helix-turn-helix transcriptional regulator [Chloroflexota bacterium]